METPYQRARRWFWHGMNLQERIDYYDGWVDRLREENARLRQELNYWKPPNIKTIRIRN